MADAAPPVGAGPDVVKAEADGASPMALDDDIYEDAGDLEFFDSSLPGNPYGNIYLAQVPPYLYEAWEKLDDDAEIEIGTIRQWTSQDKKGRPKYNMRLLVRSDLGVHQNVPKEYELDLPMGEDVQNSLVKNTYIFTEQDLPGFKAKNKARAEAAAAGIPAHLLRQKEKAEKPEQQQQPHQYQRHGRRGRQEYFRKAIPKKTAIYGKVRYEINSAPVKNPETDHIMNLRTRMAMVPKSQVTFSDTALSTRLQIISSGRISDHTYNSDFIKSSQPAAKAKKVETKTARMPENDLLDAIFACFTEYRYWSMRSLRAQIPQPEIYLRQTLEKVAELHRSGKFANHWELKAENRRVESATAEVKASEFVDDEAAAESDDGGDEDDVKMEDVALPV